MAEKRKLGSASGFVGAEEKINQFAGTEFGVGGDGDVNREAPFEHAGVAEVFGGDFFDLRADAGDV